MSQGITKVFNREGQDLYRKLFSERIRPDMSRKQQTAIRREIENSDHLKKFVIGWRIRPWVLENGKSIQTCETYPKFEDAKKRLREIANQVEQKTFTRPAKIPTVGQACENFIKSKKADATKDGGERSESTVAFYQNIIQNHIKPVIGDYKLDDITKEIALSAREKWCEKLGISVNKVLMVARAVYEEHGDICSKNPFKQINNVPRKDGIKQDEIGEVDPNKVYSRAEVETLLSNVENHRDRLMLRIAAECGTRDGELLGLTLDNVLPVVKVQPLNAIQIVQQWRCRNEYDEKGTPILKRLKTKHGFRTVKVSQELALELAKWKRDHANNPVAYSHISKKNERLMFVNGVGHPCHRKDLSKAMARAIEKANENGAKLKELDFYSLRHHFASILIARMQQGKLTDLEIAYLMGHKDSTITRKVYAKFLQSESTYDPDKIFTNVEEIVPEQPLAEMEPVSEMLN
jgi:integrase